jgi:hypothetical protein
MLKKVAVFDDLHEVRNKSISEVKNDVVDLLSRANGIDDFEKFYSENVSLIMLNTKNVSYVDYIETNLITEERLKKLQENHTDNLMIGVCQLVFVRIGDMLYWYITFDYASIFEGDK